MKQAATSAVSFALKTLIATMLLGAVAQQAAAQTVIVQPSGSTYVAPPRDEGEAAARGARRARQTAQTAAARERVTKAMDSDNAASAAVVTNGVAVGTRTTNGVVVRGSAMPGAVGSSVPSTDPAEAARQAREGASAAALKQRAIDNDQDGSLVLLPQGATTGGVVVIDNAGKTAVVKGTTAPVPANPNDPAAAAKAAREGASAAAAKQDAIDRDKDGVIILR